jgi:hypothetical protein
MCDWLSDVGLRQTTLARLFCGHRKTPTFPYFPWFLAKPLIALMLLQLTSIDSIKHRN